MNSWRSAIILMALIGFIPTQATAFDADDELKVEEGVQDFRFEAVKKKPNSQDPRSAYPEQASAIEKLITDHIAYANDRDLEAYLACFHEDIGGVKLQRDYAARVMQLPSLHIELLGLEFQTLQLRAALVHTRQLATYVSDGENQVDDAIITYRLKELRGKWQIVGTERKRLLAR